MVIYKSLDLSSGNGLKPSIWGPYVWYYLFVTTYYVEQYNQSSSSQQLGEFYHHLSNTLYCSFCRNSMIDYMCIHPPLSTESMVFWLYKLRSFVNRKLDKDNISFDQVIPYYIEKSNEKNTWDNKKSPTLYYQDAFWITLYCLAFNFPICFNTENKEIYLQQARKGNATQKLITLMIGPLLLGNSVFVDKRWSWAQNVIQNIPNYSFLSIDNTNNSLESTLPQIPYFCSRHQAIDYIYEWESKTHHQGSFGTDKIQVIHYFEKNFRSN